ncbi:MAG: PHP domain-containing protein, partial [Holophaga sp.]|nr:PHP domain-containing protein [Holophaga sp.]
MTFTYKQRPAVEGDLHAHTLASDGVLSVEELAQRAARHGLDFIAVTDHNQFVALRAASGEWCDFDPRGRVDPLAGACQL